MRDYVGRDMVGGWIVRLVAINLQHRGWILRWEVYLHGRHYIPLDTYTLLICPTTYYFCRPLH
jgi:hypothetical protein